MSNRSGNEVKSGLLHRLSQMLGLTSAPQRAVVETELKTTEAGMSDVRQAKFQIGQVVRHRFYPFRGVIFDVDPVFDNTEEWWESIPEEIRPRKDQPYYHLLAENEETEYVAYVSEQNLIADETGEPVRHPQVPEFFTDLENGCYRQLYMQEH